ncbi:MAG: N-6 DNA methylase [Chloroflexi bacterium]|nr:N-6 DNA methylase [Chloroflexota bacterium]
MPEPSTLDALLNDVFPAMCEASFGAPSDAVARLLAWLVAGRIAAARGLHLPLDAPAPALGPAAEVGRAALDDLDFDPDGVYLPGEVYSRLLAARYEQGSYYTPPALARQVAEWVLGPYDGPRPPTMLDPAMGSGNFLLAAGEMIAARWGVSRWEAAQHLHGLDSDAGAVDLARLALWLWAAEPGTTPADLAGRLRCADALLGEPPPARFDAVLGNPPYASVFTRAQGDDSLRDALKARYRTAVGSFDLAVPFVERAVELCADGGRVGLVLPNKLLAASYAEALREWLGKRATVEVLADYTSALPFDADVYPVVVVLRKEPPQASAPLTVFRADGRLNAPALLRRGTQADLHAPGGVWGGALDPAWSDLRMCFERGVPLREVAELAGGLTVGEAYNLRDRVSAAGPGMLPADALQLITSGLIRRGYSLWGRKEVRYLKRRFRRPAIVASALPPRRREQARAHKLIVAGLALRPQAMLDRGMAQAAVSTTIIYRSAWPLGALGAVLNSALMARLYRALFGGLALAGGYLRFGQRELALLPVPDVPADDPRVRRLEALAGEMARADAVTRGHLDAQIDALVCDLYGVEG